MGVASSFPNGLLRFVDDKKERNISGNRMQYCAFAPYGYQQQRHDFL